MNRFDALFLPVFLVSLLVWFGLSLYVLLDRLVYDLRQRRSRLALAALGSPELETLAPAARAEAVQAILDRLSAATQDRLVADPRMPQHVVEAFAAGLLARRGLARLLRDSSRPVGNKWRRISALVVLARIRHDRAHPALERALQDPDPDLAGTAVALLGSLRDGPAAASLIAALAEGRFAASRIAAQLDRFPDWIVPLLRPLLDDAQAANRYWGVILLGRFAAHPELAGPLMDRTRDGDPAVRKAAVQGLGGFPGPATVAAVLERLDDPVPYVRAHALRTLGELGNHAAAPRLAAALADPDWSVRLAAKETLVLLGESVWPQVAGQLEAEDAFARNGAAEVLQNMGLLDRWIEAALADPASPCMPALVQAMRAGGHGLFEATLAHSDPLRHARLLALLGGPSPAPHPGFR